MSAHLELNLYDDGIILVGAQQLLAGQQLYKDSWTLYSPGQFYLVAGLLKVFGPNIFVPKLLGALFKASIALCVYLAVQAHTSRAYAFFATLVLFPVLALFTFDVFPVLPALSLILLALLLLSRLKLGQVNRQAFFAGVALAAAGLFRHDLAIYAIAAFVLYLIVWTRRTVPEGESGWGTAARVNIRLLAGTAVIGVPALALMLWAIGWQPLYESFLLDPRTVYVPNRSLPWPGLFSGMDASVYFPYVLSILFAGWFVRGEKSAQTHWLVLLCITMLLLSVKGWVRTGFYHMLQALVPALILFFIMLYQDLRRKKWAMPMLLLVAFSVLIVPLLQLGSQVAWRQISSNVHTYGQACAAGDQQRQDCLLIDHDYLQVVDWVRQNTAPTDCIYVGPGRHDKVFVNAVAVYFLAQRQPCTRWYETHPGLQTQAAIQQSMRGEMATSQPAAVILDARWADIQEPNASRHSSGVFLLDDYFKENYSVVARFASVSILQPIQPIPQRQPSEPVSVELSPLQE